MTTATVLIVDDEQVLAEFAKEIFERHGFGCVTAVDNATALEQMERVKPDLVITDLYHPGPDGIELLKELRRRRPELPLILFTGSVLIDATEDLVPGGVHYIMKPAPMVDLVEVAKKALTIREDPIES